jgi:hypothetical protein
MKRYTYPRWFHLRSSRLRQKTRGTQKWSEIFRSNRAVTLFFVASNSRECISKSGRSRCCDRVTSLTKAPITEATMATIDVTQKSQIYHTLSELTHRLQRLWATATHCSRPDCSNQKRQNYFPVSPRSCRLKSTRSFWKTCTSLNWTTGAATAKSARNGKSISEILTTFSFMRKNAGKNWPNSVRNIS